MAKAPCVSVIHAMEASLGPTITAFKQHWKEANILHVLDKSLSIDVQASGLDAAMDDRFQKLASLALTAPLDTSKTEHILSVDSKDLPPPDTVSAFEQQATSSRAILFSCSAFGSCIEKVKQQYPRNIVLKPNEAMLESAVERGGKVGVLSVFKPTVSSIRRELLDCAMQAQQKEMELDVRFVPGALAYLNVDNHKYDEMIATAAGEMCKSGDVQTLLLAMFSMARSAPVVSLAIPKSTSLLTSPGSAVDRLKQRLQVEKNN